MPTTTTNFDEDLVRETPSRGCPPMEYDHALAAVEFWFKECWRLKSHIESGVLGSWFMDYLRIPRKAIVSLVAHHLNGQLGKRLGVPDGNIIVGKRCEDGHARDIVHVSEVGELNFSVKTTWTGRFRLCESDRVANVMVVAHTDRLEWRPTKLGVSLVLELSCAPVEIWTLPAGRVSLDKVPGGEEVLKLTLNLATVAGPRQRFALPRRAALTRINVKDLERMGSLGRDPLSEEDWRPALIYHAMMRARLENARIADLLGSDEVYEPAAPCLAVESAVCHLIDHDGLLAPFGILDPLSYVDRPRNGLRHDGCVWHEHGKDVFEVKAAINDRVTITPSDRIPRWFIIVDLTDLTAAAVSGRQKSELSTIVIDLGDDGLQDVPRCGKVDCNTLVKTHHKRHIETGRWSLNMA